MPDTDPAVAVAAAAEIKAMLMIPNADTGYDLPESLCELLASHIVVEEKLTVESVKFDRPAELWASLKDAWQLKYKKAAPTSYEEKLKSWSLGDAPLAAAAGAGGGVGGLISTTVSGGTFESSEHIRRGLTTKGEEFMESCFGEER